MFKQKGVSLYLAVVIMSILSAVVLGLISLSMSGIKMVSGLENSVMSFYAANTGIEHSLYNIRKQVGTGEVSGVLEEANYNVSVDVGETVVTIKSIGSYRDSKRVIEVNYSYSEVEAISCVDFDEDGYYAYDEIYCPEGDDCCDLDADVNPGQTECFGSISNCVTWDYDCDENDFKCGGMTSLGSQGCYAGKPGGVVGWVATADCGISHNYKNCCCHQEVNCPPPSSCTLFGFVCPSSWTGSWSIQVWSTTQTCK